MFRDKVRSLKTKIICNFSTFFLPSLRFKERLSVLLLSPISSSQPNFHHFFSHTFSVLVAHQIFSVQSIWPFPLFASRRKFLFKRVVLFLSSCMWKKKIFFGFFSALKTIHLNLIVPFTNFPLFLRVKQNKLFLPVLSCQVLTSYVVLFEFVTLTFLQF